MSNKFGAGVYAELSRYVPTLDRGRGFLIYFLWELVQISLFSTGLPGSGWRVILLKLFGADIGAGVVIKPRVRVKFPWRLVVGNYSWIGEAAWIDNLVSVKIGKNCCISQGVYICTGSHDWAKRTFDLIVREVILCDEVWLGAYSKIAPGVVVGPGSVLCMGSVATSNCRNGFVYQGNPAIPVKPRLNDEDIAGHGRT